MSLSSPPLVLFLQTQIYEIYQREKEQKNIKRKGKDRDLKQ